MTTAWDLFRQATAWHVNSQHVARHNALVAAAAMADRRRELVDVEEFLAAYDAARLPQSTTGAPAYPARRFA
jgi:hypothetical protein